jgi:UDP-N-acetylmuramate dehydrogenase
LAIVQEQYDVPLAPLTTLRLGGPAATLVEAASEPDTVAAVRVADAAGTPLLLVGGGSNLVVADGGWPGLAVLLRSRGVRRRRDGDRVLVTVSAGEPWDAVVAGAVADGLAGIEALAGIPGLAGATPVQNVGAYGQEVAETVTAVTAWDRRLAETRRLSTVDCEFSYRDSIFKHTDRYVVLSVEFALVPAELSVPVAYAELAATLGIAVGERAKLPDVRQAVLELRRGKGMVLDAADHDTWSAGSFFTNPVLSTVDDFESRVDGPYPSWPAPGGTKLSAAWLIDRAGYPKGYGSGRVALSGKHTLALTNRGGATTAELLDLASEIRGGVEARFGVTLHPEPRLVGVTL